MFLENKNIIFKIRRSKVTDYAALTLRSIFLLLLNGKTCNTVITQITMDKKPHSGWSITDIKT